ncbi:thiamine biosynthesis lipoprotein [Asanoa ferruginea]|uniref:FAD:protein FMN transferase n=1 Tax=Asanoa ferruginea TaxID=53367 RepID=A0A3D9ZMJ4_9ACTN|nr:FAD:protein FMN transferase [Asanoa ferruginea]REF97732.1 thiamine biosynthesis lipoprotein [Asanoa ferruginea]GIF50927.1 FAD:protein FMN transferase [Asanoa ferruginea]
MRPDLRLGGGPASTLAHPAAANGGLVAHHTVQTSTAGFTLTLVSPEWMSRRTLAATIADAVAELRAVDFAYSPIRESSLVARLRRGEVAPDAYAPLADLVARCDAMRAATDGWFDAWSAPGGFDPSALVKGWAMERAAARVRAAGITDYAVASGGDLTVRGNAPHGGPWRIAVHHPYEARRKPVLLELTAGAIGTSGVTGRRGHVVDPHRASAVEELRAATVMGPDLAVADAYATALYAAGEAGLAWFPTPEGYTGTILLGALASHR